MGACTIAAKCNVLFLTWGSCLLVTGSNLLPEHLIKIYSIFWRSYFYSRKNFSRKTHICLDQYVKALFSHTWRLSVMLEWMKPWAPAFFPEMSAFSGFKSICKIPRLWQYEVPLRIYGISSCSTQNLSQLRTRCKLNNLFTFTMSWSLNLYDPASKSSLILKQKSSNTKHNLSSWKKARCNLWINFIYILRVIGG